MYRYKQQVNNRQGTTRSQKAYETAKRNLIVGLSVYGFICYLLLTHQK